MEVHMDQLVMHLLANPTDPYHLVRLLAAKEMLHVLAALKVMDAQRTGTQRKKKSSIESYQDLQKKALLRLS
jgi:hypothetical protein